MARRLSMVSLSALLFACCASRGLWSQSAVLRPRSLRLPAGLSRLESVAQAFPSRPLALGGAAASQAPFRRLYDGAVSRPMLPVPGLAPGRLPGIPEVRAPAVSGAEPAAAVPPGALPRYAFSDQARIGEIIESAIERSVGSIELALHGLSIPSLARALVRARHRGVRVRVIMDRGYLFPAPGRPGRSQEIQTLIDNGIELRGLDGLGDYGSMHNKFAVFDDAILETGSFNWSKSADEKHHENIVITDDRHRVDGFREYWDWMWPQAGPVNSLRRMTSEFAPAGRPPADTALPVRFRDLRFPAYSFSPAGGTEAWLVRAVAGSGTSIDLAMYSFTSNELRQALLDAKRRGTTRMRILFDRSQTRALRQMRWFLEQGFDVRLSGGREESGVMHNKFAVFDSVLLETGSFNWTENADNNNFENANFFDDRTQVEATEAYFQRLWDHGRVVSLEELDAGSFP